MKYIDAKIVFSEVPDEITLAISISGCPGTCEGCHSPWLRENKGTVLDTHTLFTLILENIGISCVCFMGGDAEPDVIYELSEFIKTNFTGIKIAWYSGKEKLEDNNILEYLDYLKLGPYKKSFGPLSSPTTNQKFYKVIHTSASSTTLTDITYKFWKETKNENSSM